MESALARAEPLDHVDDPEILVRRVDRRSASRMLKAAIKLWVDIRLPSYETLDGFDIDLSERGITIRVPLRRKR